jgi:hypothetical protein
MRHPHFSECDGAAERGPDTRLRLLKEAKMLRFQNILPALALIAVTGTTFSAYAGPCAAQISQVEQQISAAGANSALGPTGAQTVGAQLGRQPTPQTVQDAEMRANTLAQATLERAREADTADNAAACTEALSALKDRYGLQ